MTTIEQPITRSGLREELDRVLAYYATKEDLAQLETRLTQAISDQKTDLVKWMVGVQVGGIATLATIVTAIIAIMKFLGG